MKKISTLLITVGVTLLHVVPAYAEENNRNEKQWTVGGAAIIYQSPYEGEGTRVIPLPYISYDNGSLFINNQDLGYHLIKNTDNGFFIDIIGTVNDVAGVGRSSLNFDLGARAGYASANIYFDVSVLQDITAKHNGQRAIATLAIPFNQDKFSIVPSVSAEWMSRKAADHLYGISPEQNAQMITENRTPILPVYEITSSDINFNANLTLTYQLNGSWSIVAIGGANYLGSKIRDNPSIEKDYEFYGGAGLACSF